MMTSRSLTRLFLFTTLCIFTACTHDEIAGGGTDIANPEEEVASVAGVILIQYGVPAINTRVTLADKFYLPDSLVYNPLEAPLTSLRTMLTDSAGFFRFDTVNSGDYILFSGDKTSMGFSIPVSVTRGDTLVDIGEISLAGTGHLTGIVTVEDNRANYKRTISILGLGRSTVATTSGDYIFSNLPAGTYNLVYIPYDNMYRPDTLIGAVVNSGETIDVPRVILNLNQ